MFNWFIFISQPKMKFEKGEYEESAFLVRELIKCKMKQMKSRSKSLTNKIINQTI